MRFLDSALSVYLGVCLVARRTSSSESLKGCILSLITKTKDVRMKIMVERLIWTDKALMTSVLQRCTLPSRNRSRMPRDSWCCRPEIAIANAVDFGRNKKALSELNDHLSGFPFIAIIEGFLVPVSRGSTAP